MRKNSCCRMPARTRTALPPTLSFNFVRDATDSNRTPCCAVHSDSDTASWHDKLWVVGIEINGASKAYDWNQLRRERIVNDSVGGKAVVLALASDSMSFFAFERPDAATRFTLAADSLIAGDQRFAFNGEGTKGRLTPVFASQGFWHSWRTFHPQTTRS